LLAKKAQDAGRSHHFKVTVLGRPQLKKLGMGAILGVAHGSAEEPKFIIMEHRGGKRNEAPHVFVGKGVTFDTGGLNLKPERAMNDMHLDMLGGAVVIAAMSAAAQLKLPINVVGLVPAVENMPGSAGYRPGDVLRSMSGKTIEVLNTDAEGRIILADALTYAERYKPKVVVDVATLTGACMVALGLRYSGLMTPSAELQSKLIEVGDTSGDYVWPLPLDEDFADEVKGTFGDVANLGKSGYGGAEAGAAFLWQFAKSYPWAHLDIAGPMKTIEGQHLAKGASGVGVRLLVELLRSSM
jgi:leucyl aminopeptidase